MRAAALLGVAALAHLAPEHIARALQHSQAAWESALFGLEAAALWLVLAAMLPAGAALPVAAYGAMEGMQRCACRVVWPMDRPPPRPGPGQNLCDLATGLPASWASLMAASIVALQVAREAAAGRAPRHGI